MSKIGLIQNNKLNSGCSNGEESLNVKGFFQIQIGCHTDQLYHIKDEELKRPPNVVFVFPVNDEKFKIASPFGGLLYIYVCICLFFV